MHKSIPQHRNVDCSAPSSVPLLDVNRGNAALREEFLAAIAAVCDSGRFLYGPDVQEFEGAFAAICDARHAIGCASGSDALLLALMAYDIGPGDEVITSSFTFFATASCIWRLGACPVFVDIEPDGFNLDPERIEAAITPATKAIIPVHLFGQCAEMDAINDIAVRHGLKVIEDGAQSVGAEYRARPAGSIGDIGCFSFYPTKNLGGFGDGGMLTTNDDDLAQRLRQLAAHGMQPRYHHPMVGINSRLDSIQAAVLNVKLTRLGRWSSQRRANAAMYHRLFAESGLDRWLVMPEQLPQRYHVWNQFTLRVPDGQRDVLRARLTEMNIGTEVYYPIPLHQQECFQSLGYEPESLPETEQAAREVLSLPIFPELTASEQQLVVSSIAQACQTRRAAA
ncbi:MAG: DegT/DnrJ/EryC1/StrS family aminotransferase [Planctomycetaceae bacterium]|nr:MAG: DegT/DnrJ/EryC1/StrS family aminotransferase [Planctomycetaceae bacterium]